MSTAHVLYVDHQGHPAPLSRCYHATASRRLSSSVDRYPPSTLTEIDNAYCPQCLSYRDVASAASLIHCPRPQCKLCPICSTVAVVSVVPTEKACFYKCGYCSWTSKECDIVAEVIVADDGSVANEQIAKAAEDLGTSIQERASAGDKDAGDHFRTMVQAWKGVAKEEARRKAFGNVEKGARRGLAGDDNEGWSVDALEESMRVKREKAKYNANNVVGGLTLKRLALDGSEEKRDSSLEGVAPTSIALQAIVTASAPRSRRDLLPLPIPLRPRKSRRCRAELADGRPGILVKPKLNPLEGDSSLRSGHGHWWKKDSSAIHVVPKVQIVRFGSDSEGKRHALLLKVKNPTLGKVKLRLSHSGYKGEAAFEGEGTVDVLDDLLVDSFAATRINARLDSGATNDLSPTDVVELEPVKDAFLELGMTQNKEPAEVERWDASDTLKSSEVGIGDDQISSVVRAITKDSDTAWFELVTRRMLRKNENQSVAVPVALEIQIGNGSWESSLVEPLPVEGNEIDCVAIDLVVTWPNKS